jgi:hypothetical protein
MLANLVREEHKPGGRRVRLVAGDREASGQLRHSELLHQLVRQPLDHFPRGRNTVRSRLIQQFVLILCLHANCLQNTLVIGAHIAE